MIFSIGERVKVVKNTTSHNVPLGTVLTISGYKGAYAKVRENTMNYYEVDLESAIITLKDVEEALEKAENDYTFAKSRMGYMEEAQVLEFNDDDFKKHMIGKTLANTSLATEEKIEYIDYLYKRIK